MTTREQRRAALIQKFKELGLERVNKMSLAWVRLEQAPEAESADELLRELHTLKGESKVVGFSDMHLVSHRLEDLLLRGKAAGFQMTKAESSVVLQGIDVLGQMLRRSADQPAIELERIITAMERTFTGPTAAPELVLDPPQATGDVTEAPAAAAPLAPGLPRHSGNESIRIPAHRIASISEVTGEVLVEHAKSMFAISQLAARVRQLEASLGDKLQRETSEQHHEAAVELRNRIQAMVELFYRQGLYVQELDRTVRELRLVPLSTLLSTYERMVRDLALEQGKEVKLELSGTELEADRLILEALEEPLLHLLRNCVDHGIERPEVRTGVGKPSQGRIRVAVKQVGSAMTVTVQDDGAGLDPVKLRAKAKERGILVAAAAEALTDQEARELVFVSGFSTLDRATELSGRGVGMDVVKRRVEQVGGRIAIGGEPGRSFWLQITVPIAISLTRALVLKVGTALFGVPIHAIESIRHLSTAKLISAPGGRMANLEGQIVPVASFGELLGLESPLEEATFGVMVRLSGERCLLAVNHPGYEVDLVVRPLGPPLRSYGLTTGAALLPSGELLLMLDVGEVLRRRRSGSSSSRPREGPMTSSTQISGKVLLVEDSAIFRTIISSLLKEMGMSVEVANDGFEGLKALEARTPDLVVTDIQMPNMDGLAMMRRLRRDPRWTKLPVLVMSSLGSSEDLARAMDAGATAYLVKSEINEASVSKVLSTLIHRASSVSRSTSELS